MYRTLARIWNTEKLKDAIMGKIDLGQERKTFFIIIDEFRSLRMGTHIGDRGKQEYKDRQMSKLRKIIKG